METLVEPIANPAAVMWQVPLLYEDEVTDVGDSEPHTDSTYIIGVGLVQHVDAYGLRIRVFGNLTMYYTPPKGANLKSRRRPNVAADHMLIETDHPIEEPLSSYVIGLHGPAPRTVIEVLSEATAKKRDLLEKPLVYAYLGVREYILVDVTGKFLPEKLLLKRLQPNGEWTDHRDPDGGVTSELGFRLVIDDDGQVRMTDLKGHRYPRPREFSQETAARLEAEAQSRRDAKARREAEEQSRRDDKARREAEEQSRRDAKARRESEDQVRQAKEQARQLQEQKQQAEEQARQLQEQKRQAEEQARQLQEQKRQAEEQARQLQEQKRQAEEQARQAQDDARREADLRRQLEEELERLRNK